MTLQDLGSLGEFIGSILVLATLLYLARQVREARRAMLLTSVQAQRAEVMATFRTVMDSPYLPVINAKLVAGEALDEVEEQRLGAYVALTFAMIHATWAQRELTGATDILARDDGHFGIVMRLGDRGVGWWNTAGRHIYPEPFIAYIDQKIAAYHGSALQQDLGHMGEGFVPWARR